MGPATEEAIRPEANERKRKKNRRRRTAPIRLHEEGAEATEPTVDSTGRRLPTVRGPPGFAAARWPTSCSLARRPRAAHALHHCACSSPPVALQEYEKQAAAKRRALQILEIQREEEAWCVHRCRALRGAAHGR